MRIVREHGTAAGYGQHRRLADWPACDPCLAAEALRKRPGAAGHLPELRQLIELLAVALADAGQLRPGDLPASGRKAYLQHCTPEPPAAYHES
jgi:hypothetical protein